MSCLIGLRAKRRDPRPSASRDATVGQRPRQLLEWAFRLEAFCNERSALRYAPVASPKGVKVEPR